MCAQGWEDPIAIGKLSTAQPDLLNTRTVGCSPISGTKKLEKLGSEMTNADYMVFVPRESDKNGLPK